MGEFLMPSLGAEMYEGKVVEWLVHPGDAVHRGDIIAVIETDKAAIEVEVWEDGTVAELLVEEGIKVPVGTALARLGPLAGEQPLPAREPSTAAEAPTEPSLAAEPAAALPAEPLTDVVEANEHHVHGPLVRKRAKELGVDLELVVGSGPGGVITRGDVERMAVSRGGNGQAAVAPGKDGPGAETQGDGGRRRASPLARRLAREQGVDLSAIAGTGPGGAIVERDVAATPTADVPPAPAAAPPAPAPVVESTESTPMRTAIARAMSRAQREIPHYHLGQHVDLTNAQAWLDDHNGDRPAAERVLLAAVQLRAVALALRDHPDFNGYWIDDAFAPSQTIDIGVAIALRGGGLMAPAILRTDELDIDTLMARLRDLVRRTRAGRLRGSEAAAATITVTNLGDLGVETVHGVITPPQVALVGLGKPVERPWAKDGMLGVHTIVHATLAGDHRHTDGATGARFLARIDELLQQPEEL